MNGFARQPSLPTYHNSNKSQSFSDFKKELDTMTIHIFVILFLGLKIVLTTPLPQDSSDVTEPIAEIGSSFYSDGSGSSSECIPKSSNDLFGDNSNADQQENIFKRQPHPESCQNSAGSTRGWQQGTPLEGVDPTKLRSRPENSRCGGSRPWRLMTCAGPEIRFVLTSQLHYYAAVVNCVDGKSFVLHDSIFN